MPWALVDLHLILIFHAHKSKPCVAAGGLFFPVHLEKHAVLHCRSANGMVHGPGMVRALGRPRDGTNDAARARVPGRFAVRHDDFSR